MQCLEAATSMCHHHLVQCYLQSASVMQQLPLYCLLHLAELCKPSQYGLSLPMQATPSRAGRVWCALVLI
jgi:hypothetical protein